MITILRTISKYSGVIKVIKLLKIIYYRLLSVIFQHNETFNFIICVEQGSAFA